MRGRTKVILAVTAMAALATVLTFALAAVRRDLRAEAYAFAAKRPKSSVRALSLWEFKLGTTERVMTGCGYNDRTGEPLSSYRQVRSRRFGWYEVEWAGPRRASYQEAEADTI